ncbi:MAG: ABC transporter ATP-binding protein [Ruminococcaceae bacterium]|nr:ABC transporter ATP-binding protein [Oscillospiraceae bacterium]
MKKKQSLKAVVSNNLLMIRKIFRHSPQLVFLMVGQGIAYGVSGSLSMLFLPLVLNGLQRGESFPEFIPYFAVGVAGCLVGWLYGRLNYLYFRPWMQNRLHYRMHEEIFQKSMDADLICFDDPEFYNDFVWAMDESDGRAMQVLETMANFINFVISLGTCIAIMLTVSPIVVAILAARSVISFFIGKYWNKINEEQNTKAKPYHRQTAYVNRVFHLVDYAKELRTSRLAENLAAQYDDAVDRNLTITLHYNKKHHILNVISFLLNMVPNCLITIYMTLGLFEGTVPVGSFIITLTQFWRIGYMFDNFSYFFNEFGNNSLYIEKYRKFMEYVPKVKSGTLPVSAFETLELKNVSFRYTEKSDCVLKNVSLTIRKGEKIALVGYNGAGKSTLIKLLMRFYDPDEGVILLNGIDIKQYDLKAYRHTIGAVFQDFKLFSATIAENVLGRPVQNEEDRQRVLRALEMAGFKDKCSELEKGIDTMLTREFDDEGTNLSGGESQKIAIARVFAHDYDLVMMDEPSSALDPIAEYNLNHSIANHLQGKTVIFISHRLSTTRMSDMIYMFDSGSLIEQGSHKELLSKEGKYAEMFALQAKKYKSTN